MQIAIPRDRFIIGANSLIWGVVAAAWTLALTLALLGYSEVHSHHALFAAGIQPDLRAVLLFLVAWQIMTAAMMLPASLPMVRLFGQASRGQARPWTALLAFLAAYFAVWTGFAVIALTGDAGLHWLTDQWRWLADRPYLIAGSVLIVAGAFQFSPLKEQCLDECRSPLHFLWRYYGRGAGRAWTLGIRHGLFCLGCCWALMLTMFAVGVGSLTWMAALTGVMLIEKTTRQGKRLVPLVGGSLLIWGGLVLLQPAWLPTTLGAV